MRRPDLLGVGVGQPDVGDLAAVGDLLDGADDLVVGHLRVGAVVLPQGQLLDAEALEAVVDGTTEVLGRAVGLPAAAVGADVAALGGEEHPVADAELVEDRGDQALVLALGAGALLVAGAVGVGGVEERHARVERGGDGVDELLAGLGAGLVEGHQAETDRADLGGSESACLHAADPTGGGGEGGGGGWGGREGGETGGGEVGAGGAQALRPDSARTSSGRSRSGVARKTVRHAQPREAGPAVAVTGDGRGVRAGRVRRRRGAAAVPLDTRPHVVAVPADHRQVEDGDLDLGPVAADVVAVGVQHADQPFELGLVGGAQVAGVAVLRRRSAGCGARPSRRRPPGSGGPGGGRRSSPAARPRARRTPWCRRPQRLHRHHRALEVVEPFARRRERRCRTPRAPARTTRPRCRRRPGRR